MIIRKENGSWKIGRPTNNGRATYPSSKSHVKLTRIEDAIDAIETFCGWLDFLSVNK